VIAKRLSCVFLFAFFALLCATASFGNSYQIWPSTTMPSILDVGADSPVELGVSFKSDVSGYINGIRFYKSANNTGTHVGNLWTGTGTLLASATFTNETATGWQQVNFSNPVLISANTVYVASYHCGAGHYSVTPAAFATNGVDNAPLHALANTAGTPDGAYSYGSASLFPTSTYNSANYWVDVAFTPATTTTSTTNTIWPSTATPSIQDVGADSPVELGISFKSDVNGYITGIRFYKSANNTGTHVANLWSTTGTLLASATFTNETGSGWQQVNFSGPIAINANTRYVASYHCNGGHYSVTPAAFATSGVDNAPLHALVNTSSTPDGPYAYGSNSQFPTNTYNSGNYWVDVAFTSQGSGGGTGGQAALAVTPSSASFGNVVVGTSNSQAFNLSNGGSANVTISQANVTGSGFSLSGLATPLTIAPGKSANFNAAFTPTSTASSSGSISLVSNAPNSPLNISLSGTGIAATYLLGANPTSLSFGSVNTGSSGSQRVSLTNNGNSNVTIPSVNVSGAGYSASGVAANTSLTPGQTATLNVTFAPAAAGSITGSVSVASNASNSPATISLNGSGVTQTSGAPTCGLSGDSSNHVPADWATFTPPAAGQSYVDSIFGCTVTRLTDGGSETLGDGSHPGLMNFYSTLTAMNASDTLVFITYNNGSWRISDIHGNVVVPAANMPGMGGHAVWDASNGSVFYYTSNNTLYKGTVSGSSVTSTTLHSFSEYSGIVLPDASDLSQDGDHMALMGQNGNNTMDVFVWSLSQQAKTSVYTTSCTISGSITSMGQPGCVHKLLLSSDNLLSIGFANNGTGTEQGVRLWNGSTLIHLQDNVTSHYDHGYDMNGNPIVTGRDNPSSLAGFTNPCPSGWGLDVRQQGNFTSSCLLDNQPSWHISYRGGPSQPWIALSFFDTRTPGPEFFSSDANYQAPTGSNWQLYEDEIILARVDANNGNSNTMDIYRLVLARSRSMESYWAQPHATISRDGKYVVFTSNMAHPNGCPANMHVANECSDVYMIKVH
jgi:hypothetical protein